MAIKRVKVDLDDLSTFPEGRIDIEVVDATTEEDIARQAREDEEEADLTAAHCALLREWIRNISPIRDETGRA